MNSEELELSLRTEFEAHLKKVFADVHQQVAEFQNKIDAELGKHRSQMLEALDEFTTRMTASPQFDKAFSDAVAEHLKIARDDGAQLAAKALASAETMDAGSPSSVSFNFARDAVDEISSQTSQAAILQTLVKHCEHFTPRGIFFIVRHEHFVGWQAMGDEANVDEADVKSLNFPVTSDTVLSEAVRALQTTERAGGAGEDEGLFLQPLGLRPAAGMRAIPLVARGRGVAALYVDNGTAGHPVNIEALEMLVRVAGLTVELLASNQAVRPQTAETAQMPAPAPAPATPEPVEQTRSEYESEPAMEQRLEPEHEAQWNETESTSAVEEVEAAPAYEVESFAPPSGPEEPETLHAEIVGTVESAEPVEAQASEDIAPAEPEPVSYETTNGFEFSSDYEPQVQHFEDADVVDTPQFESNGSDAALETVSAQETAPAATPGGTRRLDLPIEVSDEERPTHTKARRFARLLVSEIKLYNEEKVKQGRQAGDLYERLKEAIDRSREMYEKRVDPPVSSKFDYFHYELVNDLAEGDAQRLGNGYPGSAV